MKVIASNRRAHHDYDIVTRYTAGLVLSGGEVKSVRAGHVSLKGSYVVVKNHELYLLNATISPYKFSRNTAYEPTRPRKLLLHKKEINQIIEQSSRPSNSAVPLAIGTERNHIKLEIGLGQGRHRYDKRELMRQRIMLREAQRELKSDSKSH